MGLRSATRHVHQQQLRHDSATGEQSRKEKFMAARNNVYEKRTQLRNQLTPIQNYCLEEIQNGTVGKWKSVGEFDLRELAALLYVRIDKLYDALKVLEGKGLIRRQKIKHRGLEQIGLNPEAFGQILIDSVQKKEINRLQLVVDNSRSHVDNFEDETQNEGPVYPQPGSVYPRFGASLPPNKGQTSLQVAEIIDENRPLDSLDIIDILDAGKNKSFSPGTGTQKKGESSKDPMTEEDSTPEEKAAAFAAKEYCRKRGLLRGVG